MMLYIFNVSWLATMKIRALRRRVWFKALNPLERNILDLTLKVVEKVRSRFLAKILREIVDKLTEALDGKINSLIRTVGWQAAQKISLIACSWSYEEAEKWAYDVSFMRFLAVCYVNTPRLLRM